MHRALAVALLHVAACAPAATPTSPSPTSPSPASPSPASPSPASATPASATTPTSNPQLVPENIAHTDPWLARIRRCAIPSPPGIWHHATKTIDDTTDELWCRSRDPITDHCSRPATAFARFTYGAISEAYIFEPPSPPRWGMTLSVSRTSLTATFGRTLAADGRLTPELQIGRYEIAIEHANRPVTLPTQLQLELDLDLDLALAPLLQSPDSLRTTVTQHLTDLEQAVHDHLARASVVKITRYEGCVPIERPFDAAERRTILAQAHTEIARRKRLIDAHHVELHALLTAKLACN